METPLIDTTVTHSARVWNYWLGGKDNYPVDREMGDQVHQVFPEIVDIARAGRALLLHTISHLTGQEGIDQFLDLGTGLPTADNTHEVAQRIDPTARVVYVDNDPLVLTHARALLTSTPESATDYVHADLREMDTILEQATKTLDFGRPVAVTMFGVLAFIPEDDQIRAILRRVTEAVPSRSFLALTHSTSAVTGERVQSTVEQWNASGAATYHLRSPDQITGFFDGWDLLGPGVVSCPLWRPSPTGIGTLKEMDEYCGVARKP